MSDSIKASDYAAMYPQSKDSYDISSLFSSTSTKGTSNSNFLADYASIKNGSYGKVLKAYYGKNNAAKNVSSKEESVKESKKLSTVRNDAANLQKSAQALMDESLYEKKKITKTDENGKETETYDYDWDAITSAVKSFAENYNSLIKSSVEVNDTKTLRNTAWLTGNMDANKKLLSDVGITIGKENKLEVDEDKLKEADISTLKTLFTGYGSLADKVEQKGGQIQNAASSAIAKLAKSYGKDGLYSGILESGGLYDSLF